MWYNTEEFDRESRTNLFTNTIIDTSVKSVEGYENTIAVVYGLTDQEVIERSNKIAATPDMLKALEATLPYLPKLHKHQDGSTNFSSPHHVFVQVRAAISKAKGEN